MLEASVIIPVYNEADYIFQLVGTLNKQTIDASRLEVLFVDGGSTDNTVKLINDAELKFEHHILSNPARIVPKSMNLGVEKAKGSIIIRLDAHSSYRENYLELLLDYIIKHDVVNVGTCMSTEPRVQNPRTNSIGEVLSSKFGVGNSSFRTGTNEVKIVDTVPFGCFRKEDVLAVGGYNNKLIRNQDIELNARLRSIGEIHLLPEVLITYHPRMTFTALAKNNYGNGKWNILTVFITKRWESLSLRHFVPLIFLLSLIGPLLLALIDIRFGLLSLLSLVTYLLAVSTISFQLNSTETRWYYLVWSFITLHISYGWGSLMGILSLPKYALNSSKS